MRNAVNELNEMLEEKAQAAASRTSSASCTSTATTSAGHQLAGRPDGPMAQQMAAMQSLMDSMTPEQRAELWNAMQAVMNDPGIQEEMAGWPRTWAR